MIDSIREQAGLIQERLWEIAESCYGLHRNHETVARIIATCTAEINKQCKEDGLDPLVQDVVQEPVDSMLALVFLCASLAEREEDPSEALAMLVVAAEMLGVLGVIGRLNILGKAGPIDFQKMGALGESLLHGVLAKGHAAAMAKMRHAENYLLIDYALKYWRENIDSNLSAQKAATELTKVVSLSHKKLAEIVSAEKKKTSRVRKLELVRKT